MNKFNGKWFDGASLCALVVAMCTQIDARSLGRDTLDEGLGYATKTIKLALGDAVFALVVAYFLARVIQTRSWKRLWWPPLPCFALVFALVLSLLHSPTIFEVLRAGGKDAVLPLREAIVEIVQWVGYFLVAPWVFVNLLFDRRDENDAVNRVDLGIRALFFGVAASAILATVQTVSFTQDAPRGLWTSPNIYGAFLAFCLPLLLETETRDERAQLRLTFLGFVLAIVALVTLTSFWAVLALFLGLLMAAIARPGTPKIRIFRLGVVGMLVVVAVLSWRNIEGLRGFREESSRIASQTQRVKKQLVEWQVATRFGAPRERALATGFGPGNYQSNIGTLYQYDSVPNEERMPPDSNNLWLVQAVSTGVLGLGALLWTVGHFFGLAWRNRGSWLGAGVVGALGAWIFVNFFHASLVRGAGLVLAFLFALAVVAASNQSESSAVKSPEKS